MIHDLLAWDETDFKGFIKQLAGNIAGLSSLIKLYRQYRPTYHQLASRLAETDRLIDQLVYQLYGLTEDEIAMVEGA